MRRTMLSLAFLAAGLLHAGEPQSVDPAQIPSYKRLAPGIATGGQPSAEALGKLGAMGFKTVVNLRTPNEDGPPEQAVIEAQGLRYVSVPITAATLSLADVVAVEKVLYDPAAQPVLFHCAASSRTGAVWAAIQARKGKSLDEALAAGREAGMRSPALEEAVRRVVGGSKP